MNITTRIAMASVLTLLAASQVRAQDPTPGTNARVTYDAAYYASFAPETAFDMVTHTPGFMLAKVDDEDKVRRGFAGAVGNVLIDGRRLAAKSQTAEDVLKRIPAAEVVRIELLRGSDVSGDASGASLLANVVRRSETGGGAWQAGFELANRDKPAPNGWFAYGGRQELTEYSVGGSTYALERNLPGQRTVHDAAGNLTARRADDSPREFAEYGLNGQAMRPLGEGTFTLTGQAHYSRYHHDESLVTTTPDGDRIGSELIPYTETKRTVEVGLAWQRSIGRWDADFGAIGTRRRFASDVESRRSSAAGSQDSKYRQRLERDSGESILRASFARPVVRGRLDTGVEVAVNTLDGATSASLDLGAGPVPRTVPNSNLVVRENRAEAFASYAWTLNDRWSLDSRLAGESSHLAFSGDTRQDVSLSYVKPRLQLTRAFGPHQLHVRVFRDVGQLDFNDFVSAVEVADALVHGGNPDLRPQTAWVTELDADLRFPGDAALRVRAFRQVIDDVVDFVPVGPADDDARGNIGRGTLIGAEVVVRMPLAALLPAASLQVSGTWQDSDVRDPVAGEHRAISRVPRHKIQAELRQDLAAMKLSWGLAFAGESSTTDFRFRETDRTRASSSLDGFVETTALKGFKLRLQMLSILDAAQLRERRFYAPDRGGGVTGSEASRWHPGYRWLLTVSGRL
jgi:hypothetical protein